MAGFEKREGEMLVFWVFVGGWVSNCWEWVLFSYGWKFIIIEV
jgi:hypothetical protein